MRATMIFLTAALIFCWAGCVSGPSRPDGSAAGAMEQSREVRNGAQLLQAIAGSDYPAFAACLANGPAAELTRADFDTSQENMNRQFGKITGFRFLTPLETPLLSNLVWVVGFERRDADGKPVRQELLFRVIQGELEGETVIFSFGFL